MKDYEDIAQKLFQIERNLSKDAFEISDISEIIPASIMVHTIQQGTPQQISYMNQWGCHHLGVELEELNLMREEYYNQFFIQQDLDDIYPKVLAYCMEGDYTKQLNFFQRVKLYKHDKHSWFYTVCKLLAAKDTEEHQKLVMLSSPVEGVGTLMTKVQKVLDENEYISMNYKKFSLLTKREKEILSLLCVGKSTPEIAELLFISKDTAATHRKNIIRKLNVKSFAEMYRFALAFELTV